MRGHHSFMWFQARACCFLSARLLRRTLLTWFVVFAVQSVAALADVVPSIPNPGFELINAQTGFAEGWIRGLGPGTEGAATVDETVFRSGRRSLHITSRTPHQAYRYVLVNTDWLQARPETTYVLRFFVRGRAVGRCYVGVDFEGAGEHRQHLPTGDYEWREVSFRFTTPPGSGRVSIRFAADDIADLWFDDLSLTLSPLQLANITEHRRPWPWKSWYPRTLGRLPGTLLALDLTGESPDVCGLMTALQGLVNRHTPRLYLFTPSNPPRYDEVWLRYLQEKGYTGPEERLASPEDALRRFRSVYTGAVVWDDSLPGSRHAAWMIGAIENALPCSVETARRFGLPIVRDLRGLWKRNVDAYRYVWEHYRDKLCLHLLAWEYPLATSFSSRDVMVQQKAFLFWVSAPLDNEVGADPAAEMEFLEELLSQTPGNVPVMGWPMHVTKGIEEYTAVRLLSEYGKWVPGTSFTSNGTVLSAVRPNPRVFRHASDPAPRYSTRLEQDKVYLSINILDSGDAHWYWQFYQRRIWADPERGSVPTGYGMNMTLLDALPLVAQWYYEHRAPGDSFFGFLYMNAPVYASRFRKEDRERIWSDFVRRTGTYLKRLGMDGLELYTGGTASPSAPKDLLRRFTRGIPGLRYILAGLGRHADVRPEASVEIMDGVVVFHTLTNFRVWSLTDDLSRRTMEDENTWLAAEILSHTPTVRPAFMTAMAVSWTYYPSWLKDLKSRLPSEYVLVSPGELARLYREHRRVRQRD